MYWSLIPRFASARGVGCMGADHGLDRSNLRRGERIGLDEQVGQHLHWLAVLIENSLAVDVHVSCQLGYAFIARQAKRGDVLVQRRYIDGSAECDPRAYYFILKCI